MYSRMNDEDILHLWILPDVVWKRSSLQRIVGLLHRSLMQSKLCDLSYKLARQWLSGVNHGMTNEEIVAVMYHEYIVT